MNRICRYFACIAVLVSTAGQLQAAIISHNFQARVTTTSGSPFGLNPSVHDLITGSFSYNTSAPIINSGPTFAVYSQAIPAGISMVIDGTTIEASTYGALIENGNSFDSFQIYGGKGSGIPGSVFLVGGVAEPDAALYWYMQDSSHSVYNNTSLPSSVSVSDFDLLAASSFLLNTSPFGSVSFEITSLAVVVPEPSTFVIATLGLVGIGFSRRKQM